MITCLRKYMSTEDPLTVAYVKFSIGFRNRGSLIPVKPDEEDFDWSPQPGFVDPSLTCLRFVEDKESSEVCSVRSYNYHRKTSPHLPDHDRGGTEDHTKEDGTEHDDDDGGGVTDHAKDSGREGPRCSLS